ncbi:hypothetical protein PVL29_017189 [Vitis rotundifolia]|uniref:Intron-binding protein aquarius n=1 Tax=Vitis rotundifolia TaxID=103349 RepID=A0AA39DHH1_VITRO|nr:hypothetical protein PVL29_017189 [Vitis rotundifolia]
MSMILMVNEKFRENVAASVCFYDRKGVFKAFIEKVLRFKEQGRSLSIAEKTNYLLFMINSLEDEIVSETVLSLASLQSWLSLSYGEPFDPSTMLEAKFLRNIIEEFLEVLDSKVFSHSHGDDEDNELVDANGFEKVNDACILYCERFMEFLIDLLSQLPTRRYLRPIVSDVAIVAKCHLSALYTHGKGKLFAQLVDLLQFYEGFEINDHVGTQLNDDEVLQSRYDRLQSFQLLAFKKIPKLFNLARLAWVPPRSIEDMMLKLVSREDPWSERVDFLIEVMVSFFEKQQSQKEAINALPLYPNEQIMWDESLVTSINYSGEGCLALPKLNLQFLTLHNYLLRNFNLFRLASTYEIHEDIQEAVPHLLAYINHDGETAFRGWSRMAVPIRGFKITKVKQPNIGEVKPSSVTAEVTFSISSYKAQIRSEWNALKEHDVLFLLSICPSFEPLSAEEAAKASVPQRLGLQFVRGCEVIEICDEEGTLMNDFSGRIKRDEWKPPKGELRTVTVALDTAQYHMDENNFKAILESIRDRMNETCIVPDRSHNIFLGYGNPSAIGAISSGIQPGLTMVVGPPGTGKTDTAVQILNVLYHNCPSQGTLIITHSNQRDVLAHYLLRLGQGEQELATDLDFSREGRFNAMLVRWLELLSEVERLARSLQLPEDVGCTCETAGYFWLLHVYSHWEQFLAACSGNEDKPTFVQDRFPFKEFFSNTPQPGCFRHLKTMFQELEECRVFELLKSTADRANYLMTKQAKIVAMRKQGILCALNIQNHTHIICRHGSRAHQVKMLRLLGQIRLTPSKDGVSLSNSISIGVRKISLERGLASHKKLEVIFNEKNISEFKN